MEAAVAVKGATQRPFAQSGGGSTQNGNRPGSPSPSARASSSGEKTGLSGNGHSTDPPGGAAVGTSRPLPTGPVQQLDPPSAN